MTYLNEDTLVRQTTAYYLKDHLGRDSVYAYNQETFGERGLPGRNFHHEVVLTRYLKEALKKFYQAEEYHQDYLQKNPGGYTCHAVYFDSYIE